MKIVTKSKGKTTTFEDLEEGQVFKDADNEQLKIKTDDSEGVCLDDGGTYAYENDEKVIPVECELHIK